MKKDEKKPENTDQSDKNAEKSAPSSIKSPKPHGRSWKGKLLLACASAGCFIVVVLFLATIIGVFAVPGVEEWLVDHNFMESRESKTETIETVDGTREVIVETNWVTDVVETSEAGVVSVAVSEVGLDAEQGVVEDSTNIGTGFVIDSSGLILTNQHVVSDPGSDYLVIDKEGNEYEVEEIARDDVNDLAILKVTNGGKLKALPLGNSGALKVGQFVVAIGTPLGDLPGTVTSGIVSGLGRSVTASSGGFWGVSRTYEDVIQTDAAVNPGNSGGPLLDVDGSVIGINFATTSGADNISFAIPIDRAKEKIAEYKQYGKFVKPYLGVEYQLISPVQARMYRDVVPGALVVDVIEDSPAAKAGVKNGDIITEIAGESVGTSFSALIQKHEVGDEVKLKVYRNGEYIEKKAILEEAD